MPGDWLVFSIIHESTFHAPFLHPPSPFASSGFQRLKGGCSAAAEVAPYRGRSAFLLLWSYPSSAPLLSRWPMRFPSPCIKSSLPAFNHLSAFLNSDLPSLLSILAPLISTPTICNFNFVRVKLQAPPLRSSLSDNIGTWH